MCMNITFSFFVSLSAGELYGTRSRRLGAVFEEGEIGRQSDTVGEGCGRVNVLD